MGEVTSLGEELRDLNLINLEIDIPLLIRATNFIERVKNSMQLSPEIQTDATKRNLETLADLVRNLKDFRDRFSTSFKKIEGQNERLKEKIVDMEQMEKINEELMVKLEEEKNKVIDLQKENESLKKANQEMIRNIVAISLDDESPSAPPSVTALESELPRTSASVTENNRDSVDIPIVEETGSAHPINKENPITGSSPEPGIIEGQSQGPSLPRVESRSGDAISLPRPTVSPLSLESEVYCISESSWKPPSNMESESGSYDSSSAVASNVIDLRERRLIRLQNSNRKTRQNPVTKAKGRKRSSNRFQCDHCSKSFSERRILNAHKKISHYKQRPFRCSRCGKRFIRKRHLDGHYNNLHLKIRRFSCEICHRRFYWEHALKKHACVQARKKQVAKQAAK